MKILLTLDLNLPRSPERTKADVLMRFIWDQLQVTGIPIEVLIQPDREKTLASWLAEASSLEAYKTEAPSPLTSYDLIIGVDLPPGAEALFTSMGIRTLIVRTVPCDGFSRFFLARANFQISPEDLAELPSLKNLYQQNFPLGDVPMNQRNWWLANRFLLNKGTKYPSTVFIGTTLFQPERIRSGSLVNLCTYADTLLTLLQSCPNFYYCSPLPVDSTEFRFMKTLGATCPSISLPQLLARDEIQNFISLDSGLMPVVASFNKKLTVLGSYPTWVTLKLRQFCNRDFISRLCEANLFSTALSH